MSIFRLRPQGKPHDTKLRDVLSAFLSSSGFSIEIILSLAQITDPELLHVYCNHLKQIFIDILQYLNFIQLSLRYRLLRC